VFTFYWPETGHWEGQDFRVTVEEAQADEDKPKNAQSRAAAQSGSKAEQLDLHASASA
jgi:hypothetical protein